MKDINGKEIVTGDIVEIKGAYYKNDNGLYFVTHSPEDPSWCGNDHSLTKICKNGRISTNSRNIAFWPLGSFTNNRHKNAECKLWNKKHATIEIIYSIDNSQIIEHFIKEAENIQLYIKREKWDFGEDSEVVKKSVALYNFYLSVADRMETKRPKIKKCEKTTETPKITISELYTYAITEDTDTRDNSRIYIVKVKESLDREEYRKFNQLMQDIGGYYSRFKHGFIFKDNPKDLLNVDITEVDNPTENSKEDEKEPKKQEPVIEYDITEDKSPSGKIIYLVKVKNELSKEDFSEVKRKFAKIQGYHSTLMDGFIFKYNPTEKLIV